MQACAVAFATTENFDFSKSEIKSLELVNNAGNSLITTNESSETKIEIEKKSFHNDKCDLITKVEGSNLIIKSETKKLTLTDSSCIVNFKILIPKTTTLDIKSGSGDVDVKGIESRISFAIGSGDITIDGKVPSLKGSAGSGDIEISGVNGATDIKAGSGDIDLKFAGKFSSEVNVKTGTGDIELNFSDSDIKGKIEASTGTGDATVYFPQNSKIKSQLSTGLGHLVNELGNNQKADVNLSLKSGVGDIKVLKK